MVGRDIHQPTKVFEFVKLILRLQRSQEKMNFFFLSKQEAMLKFQQKINSCSVFELKNLMCCGGCVDFCFVRVCRSCVGGVSLSLVCVVGVSVWCLCGVCVYVRNLSFKHSN